MTASAYSCRAVDGRDPEIGRVLRCMHKTIFADTAPQIVPKEGWWWLAWLAGVPVGFAGLRLSKSTPGTASLHRAGVLLKNRGNRLQRRFIRLREAKARKLGMTRMVTDTTDAIASSNSLMDLGYRLFTPGRKWAFKDSLYWEKTL